MTLYQQIEKDNQWMAEKFEGDIAAMNRTIPVIAHNNIFITKLRDHYRAMFSKFIRPHRERSLAGHPASKDFLVSYLASLNEFKERIKATLTLASTELGLKTANIKVPDILETEITRIQKQVDAMDLSQTIDLDRVVANEEADKKLGQVNRFKKVKETLLAEFDKLKMNPSDETFKKALAVHQVFLTFNPEMHELTALKKALSKAEKQLTQAGLHATAKESYGAAIKKQIQKIDAHLANNSGVQQAGMYARNPSPTQRSPEARPKSPNQRK